ncbi:MAG: DUF937 domain-containing protein [Parvibaculaceae bacterium]
MAVMDILRGAQNGEFFANAGRAAGVDAAEAERALAALAPAIVLQLRKRAEDPQAFEGLLDLLEDGNGDAFLDDESLMDDPELVSDGKVVLADIYGSAAAAQKALAIKPGDGARQRLAAIGASAVLAALARGYNRPLGLVGAQPAAGGGDEQGGIFSTIVEAVIKGAVQGATRQIAPKRRRRRSTSGYFGTRKKRTTRRRRSTTPSLEQIFGELIGTLRR